MDVWEIRTPTDLRDALTTDAIRIHFLAVPDALEPDVRAASGEIFADFTLMEPASDPPGLIDSYLEGIAEPLSRLRAHGMQLVAVKTADTIEILGATPRGTQVEFLI